MEQPVIEALARLPHQPPMRVVDDLIAAEGEASTWRLSVPSSHPLVRDGELATAAAIELVAQAAAAHAALGGAHGRGGSLVRVRSVRLLEDVVPVDVPLVAAVRRTDGTGGATAAFHVTLSVDGRLLLDGGLLVRLEEVL